MTRPFVGLAVCLLVGCGTSAPPETNATAGGATAAVEDVSTKVSDQTVVPEANTSTHKVAFKVPGMT